MNALVIAGVQSGCGKTTATLALMQWLTARGIGVAPFKAGPDFLDPMWHAAACGRASYNLDTRMMGIAHCRALFAAKAAGARVALIEGAMGMFDGARGVGGEGSAAHLAAALGVPVLLVVSASGMSGSIVPLVEGFARRARDAGAGIAGVVANHVGSTRHAEMLRDLLRAHDLPPLVAWLENGAAPLLSRHLGLKMPEEAGLPDLARALHADEAFFAASDAFPAAPAPWPAKARLRGRTIAVARDGACCFIYPANLEWLAAEGAEIRFFSPLAGEPVPPEADALWLPGGYPELHLEALAASPSLASIRAFIGSGAPSLAECGGMMMLGREIEAEGRCAPAAGAIPCRFAMQGRLAGLGYREEASGARGHEFHHSARECMEEMPPAFDLPRGDRGLRVKGLRASYVHWYFPSAPAAVAAWLGGENGGRA